MKKLIIAIVTMCLCAATVLAQDTIFPQNITTLQAVDGAYNIFSCDASGSYIAIVGSTGNVSTLGFNTYGQLGNGSYDQSDVLVQVQGISGVGKVAAGKGHVVALKQDGTVAVWGKNDKGQLGLGDTENRNTPVILSGVSGVMDVAVGDDFTILLKYDGSVYVFGDNTYGQLGIGTTENALTPTLIPDFTGVAAISTGNAHAFAVVRNGNTYAWGKNTYGQLGDGTTENRLSPTRTEAWDGVDSFVASEDFTAVVKKSGMITVSGKNDKGQLGMGNTDNVTTPTVIPKLTGVYAAAAGATHMAALCADGSVYTWGDNTYGQLGDMQSQTSPVKVTGVTSCLAVAAGVGITLYTTGNGSLYMLGNLVNDIESNVPVVIPDRPDSITDVGILINNEWLVTDPQPIIVNDRTLVPMRAIFEKLGATLEWNAETRTVTAVSVDKTIQITINSDTAYVNGTAVPLDVPAQIVSDRTMVPVRFISESLGCTVEWDKDTRTVMIKN